MKKKRILFWLYWITFIAMVSLAMDVLAFYASYYLIPRVRVGAMAVSVMAHGLAAILCENFDVDVFKLKKHDDSRREG